MRAGRRGYARVGGGLIMAAMGERVGRAEDEGAPVVELRGTADDNPSAKGCARGCGRAVRRSARREA